MLHAHLSSVLRRLGRLDESITHGERAAALRTEDPIILNDLALAYMERGDYAEAEATLRRALALHPHFPEAHNNLGLVAVQTGRAPEAVAHFEQVLALQPGAAHAYVNLLDAYDVRSADDRHLREIERRLAGQLNDPDRMLLSFAAAKAYADLDRREDFLQAALRACALKRRSVRYDETATLAVLRQLGEAPASEAIAAQHKYAYAGTTPIFIVSMPRAGSTLVEQVLSSHSGVYGAGELHDFSAALADVVGAGDAPLLRFLANPDSVTLDRIGQNYIARVTRRTAAAYVVDKQPANFMHLGLIHMALPNAKIVHVHRNPVDTCVSCFSKHFTAGLHHTYDLGELGRYYRAYHALMAHWRSVLPANVMLDVRYEDLVGDLEGQARRLLAHCGLPWDDAVLAFHRADRPVKTHSQIQVRRPLYSTAIGRWRGYEAQLRPLLDALGDLAA